MIIKLVLDLSRNVAILLAFVLIYDLFWMKEDYFRSLKYKILAGFIIGGISILIMISPFNFGPGVIFDTRTVLFLNSALFFTPLTTIIAALIAALYRFYLGGTGVLPGIATIIIASLVGILWKKLRPMWKGEKNLLELIAINYLVHILVLPTMFFLLDKDNRVEFISTMALPMLTLYPFAGVLFSRLMINRVQNHRLKEKLKINKERYDSFINRNKDLIFMKDEKGRYLIVNDAFCNALKLEKNEIIGYTDADIFKFDPIAAQRHKETDSSILERGEPEEILEVSSEHNVYETTKFPITLENNAIGVGGIVRDITLKYKKDEMQKVLLYLSQFSTVSSDIKGFFENLHIQMKRIFNADNLIVARYHSDIKKYSFPYYEDRHETINKSADIFDLQGTIIDYIRDKGKGMLISDSQFDREFRLKSVYNADDKAIWMGAPLIDSSSKEVIGVIAVKEYYQPDAYSNDDLAIFEIFANMVGIYIERMESYIRLEEAKERAEKSEKLKSSFIANMSHEVRTPLNGIIGFTDLLITEIENPELKSYAQIANDSAHQLLAFTESVMDIAKIESGQMKINNEVINLSLLMQELHKFFIRQNLDIELILSISEGPGELIFSDKLKLYQILMNLVNNAIKFTKKGYVEIGYLIKDEAILIFIKDTGIGISRENQQNIFERFVQLETENIRNYRGVGLGLSIVKEFTHLLGGEIWVESEVDKGSSFYLKFAPNMP